MSEKKLVELYCDVSAQPFESTELQNIQTCVLLTKSHEEQLEQQNKLHYCSETKGNYILLLFCFPYNW